MSLRLAARAAWIGLALLIIPACGGSPDSGAAGTPSPVPPSLTGDYIRFVHSADGSLSQDVGRAGTTIFQAAGTFSSSMTVDTNGTISAATDTGTYSLAADGAYSWSGGAGVAYMGNVRSDASLGIAGVVAAGAKPSISVDVKKGAGPFNNATVAGTYYNVSFAFQPSGGNHYTITGLLTFDGTGGWTTTMSGNNDGAIFNGSTNTGTYAVSADGSMSLSDPGTSFIGAVLQGGDLLVLGTFGAAGRAELILCARKGGAFTPASLSGNYRAICFGSTPPGHNHFCATATVVADGAGTLTWSGSQNSEGVITSLNGMTETYAVAADGSLTITNGGIGSGLTLTGGIVAWGNLAVVSAVTAGNRLEMRLLMKE